MLYNFHFVLNTSLEVYCTAYSVTPISQALLRTPRIDLLVQHHRVIAIITSCEHAIYRVLMAYGDRGTLHVRGEFSPGGKRRNAIEQRTRRQITESIKLITEKRRTDRGGRSHCLWENTAVDHCTSAIELCYYKRCGMLLYMNPARVAIVHNKLRVYTDHMIYTVCSCRGRPVGI